MGPGWVEPPKQGPHPKSPLVVLIPGVVGVFTPCHGARLFFSPAEAVPGVVLRATCPEERRRWLLELHADASAEFGLRACWADPGAEVAR